MTNRPIPMYAALLHHALACMYAITQLPQALSSGGFGFGQIFGLVLMASALVLLLMRPNAGRWISVAIFGFGAIFTLLIFAVLCFRGVPLTESWKMLAFAVLFLALSYLLAFGKSTRAYISAVRT